MRPPATHQPNVSFPRFSIGNLSPPRTPQSNKQKSNKKIMSIMLIMSKESTSPPSFHAPTMESHTSTQTENPPSQSSPTPLCTSASSRQKPITIREIPRNPQINLKSRLHENASLPTPPTTYSLPPSSQPVGQVSVKLNAPFDRPPPENSCRIRVWR